MNASMQRLAAARPAVTSQIDERDLFARITSLPRSAQATTRTRSRGAFLIAAVVAVIVLSTGTAVAKNLGLLGWHDATRLITSPREWEARYLQATRRLTLPPGMKWPKRTLAPNTVTPPSQPGGEAVGISQTAWECYWAAAIKRGDTTAGATAYAALRDILDHHTLVAPSGSSEDVQPPAGTRSPFQIFASDGGIQYVRRTYAAAAQGRPALLEQSCRANGPVD
jgi:hypothetical protein